MMVFLSRGEKLLLLVGIFLGVWYFYDLFYAGFLISREYEKIQVNNRPEYSGLHESFLTPFLGRKVDIKDAQWHGFRNQIPLLSLTSAIFIFLSKAVKNLFEGCTPRHIFNAVSGVCLVYVVFRDDVILILLFVTINFCVFSVACKMSEKVFLAITWGLMLAMLLLVKQEGGFGFHNGMLKFEITFNFMILRMQSFNIDAYKNISLLKSKESKTGETTQNLLLRYFAYIFYVPLYLCGPILTFEEYLFFTEGPQQVPTLSDKSRKELTERKQQNKIFYFIRCGLCWLCLELYQHYFYVGAITFMGFRQKVRDDYLLPSIFEKLSESGFSEAALTIFFSHLALMFVYFKFLVIWRFFRLWAVLDDVFPVENMQRCMNNNYTVTGFWKGWHASFNKYLVKYVYIPLGGSKCSRILQLRNIFIVFLFVALWHDIEWKLFIWGALFPLIILPEMVCKHLYSKFATKYKMESQFPTGNLVICAMGGGATILVLKIVNMVGFTVGTHVLTLSESVFSFEGFKLLFWYFLAMSAMAAVMIVHRRYYNYS